jgi:fucose 4-O-acetylase-like acetyltransferase
MLRTVNIENSLVKKIYHFIIKNFIVIKGVVYNKFDGEYQYWFEDEDGEEWHGFADEFDKAS